MAIKKEGAVYEAVAALLRCRGINPKNLAIATLGRGPDHLVLLEGDPVGEYNHKARRLHLYQEAAPKNQ